MNDTLKKQTEKEPEETMIYKVPGQHRGPAGTTFSTRAAMKGDKIPDGWHSSLSAAVKASAPKDKG